MPSYVPPIISFSRLCFFILSDFPSEFNPGKRGRPFEIPPMQKAQLLQAALDHSVFRFHAYFFLCSITPASSARSICASSYASPSNAVCCRAPSLIRSARRISLGITTLPNSSMRRTIPVARTNIASFYSAFYPLSQYDCKPFGIFHLERWQRLTSCVSFSQSARV